LETTPAGSEFRRDKQASMSLRRLNDLAAALVLTPVIILASWPDIVPQVLAVQELAGFGSGLGNYSKTGPIAVLAFPARQRWLLWR